jgi:hypothetical protein
MAIENVKYYKNLDDGDDTNTGITATINGENLAIPLAPDNTDYQEILKWVEEGNTIEEAD